MGMIAIPVSHDVGRLFRQIDVPGDRDFSDHMTMIYLGDETPIKRISKIIPPLFDLLSEVKPFTVKCNKITVFPKGKKGFPVIAELKSKELHDLQEKIKKLLTKNKIKFDNKYPEFKPHLTLSYSKEKVDNIKFDEISWLINQISVYGGDVADSRLFINFPLGLSLKSKAEQCFVASDIFLKMASF